MAVDPLKYPRSEREARARTNRKIKAIERQAKTLLYEAAGYWDEGIVSGQIDMVLADLNRGLDGIREAMDEQIEISLDRE